MTLGKPDDDNEESDSGQSADDSGPSEATVELRGGETLPLSEAVRANNDLLMDVYGKPGENLQQLKELQATVEVLEEQVADLRESLTLPCPSCNKSTGVYMDESEGLTEFECGSCGEELRLQ
jgi:hypothetical protein